MVDFFLAGAFLISIRYISLCYNKIVGGEILNIKIEARSSQKGADGFVRVQALAPRDRVKNALRQMGLYWGIGLFCVLFPLLHFILVPFFLLLGIFLSARAGLAREKIIEGSLKCPECKKPFDLKPTLLRWPLSEVCQDCRWSFMIIPSGKR